jgi:hypothetical protein
MLASCWRGTSKRPVAVANKPAAAHGLWAEFVSILVREDQFGLAYYHGLQLFRGVSCLS